MDVYIYPAARADEDESESEDHHDEHQVLPQEGQGGQEGLHANNLCVVIHSECCNSCVTPATLEPSSTTLLTYKPLVLRLSTAAQAEHLLGQHGFWARTSLKGEANSPHTANGTNAQPRTIAWTQDCCCCCTSSVLASSTATANCSKSML